LAFHGPGIDQHGVVCKVVAMAERGETHHGPCRMEMPMMAFACDQLNPSYARTADVTLRSGLAFG
jgi:hypothetical protein